MSTPARSDLIRLIVAMATTCFALGVLVMLAARNLMAHDSIYALLLLLVVPLCVFSMALYARRILKAVS